MVTGGARQGARAFGGRRAIPRTTQLGFAISGTNISQWDNFLRIVQNLDTSMPTLKRNFLLTLAANFQSRLNSIIDEMNIDYTGTYRQSFKFEVTTDDSPKLRIFMAPTGEGAERLPIYWKVLERGAAPNPLVPEENIVMWAAIKLGSAGAGVAIADHIRREGIKPHPILSRLFILTINFNPVRLTNEGVAIVREAVDQYTNGIREIFFTRRGKAVRQQMIRTPSGRFQFGPLVS